MRIAKVVAVHRKAHAVDLVFMDNRAQIPMVQVMAHGGSTNTGLIDLPEPSPVPIKGDVTPTKDRDVYAVVGDVGGIPVVMGFLLPQVSQLMFDDMNRRLDRHASDVYSTITDTGDIEVHHPSGTFFRIAVDPAHEDLTSKDFDKKFKLAKNTDKLVNLRCVVANGGAIKADILIDPSGNASVTLVGNLTLAVTGNVNATVTGNLAAAITGNITSSAAGWTHTGPVTFQSNVTVNADLTASGTVKGTTDVIAGTKALKAHVHVDPQGGSTAPPT